jgi:transposase InsO family protein
VPHRSAPLTEKGRLRLARCIVEDGWPIARAAERFQVSRPTATRWAQRYREAGEAGMVDRSSRPVRSPRRTPQPVVRKIVHLRWKQRLGPVAIAGKVRVAPSTVHRVLTSCRINRLWHVDRITGEPVRRYEMTRPGELVHVDVKKLGRIPDGGGWKSHGRGKGNRSRKTKIGFDYVHSMVDDHSRLAYSEVLPDEKGATCAAFLLRAAADFATRGIDRIEEVITDNHMSYKLSYDFRGAIAALDARHLFIKPHCPWQNGKVERFNRTLATEWAYRQPFTDNASRAAALAPWLEYYNTHRRHSALGGHPPVSRLPT